MERTHFPGYSQCIACRNMISEKNIHDHILHCGRKSSIEKKLCVFCNKQIDKNDFAQHIEICRQQEDIRSEPLMKQCPVCGKFVEFLGLNCQSCNDSADGDGTGYETPRAQTPTQIENKATIQIINTKKQQTKHCVLCSQDIDQSDFSTHLSFCSSEDNTSNPPLNTDLSNHTKNSSQTNENSSKESFTFKKKHCVLCTEDINQSNFADHIASCSLDQSLTNTATSNHYENKYEKGNTSSYSSQTSENSSRNSTKRQTKQCPLCTALINESEYGDHVSSCLVDNEHSNVQSKRSDEKPSSQVRRTNSKRKQTKQCPLCSALIDEEEYGDHVTSCSNDHKPLLTQSSINIINDKYSSQMSSSDISKKKSKKECILCSKPVDEEEFVDHVTACSSQASANHLTENNNRTDLACSASATVKTKQDCILCFKPIDISEYENHVQACLAETEHQPSPSSTRTNLKCLTCNRSINKDNDLYREVACHNRHIHCLLCLQRSMEEFARNRATPICHTNLCDYELSRHDISFIPLERRLSDRLLKLCKGQQRPFCTKCHFYIDINDIENFDEHFESCDDLIPCEYCQLPYAFTQLETHARKCRSEQTSDMEKLTNFVLTKTRYPFTKEQIRFFIQQHYKNRRMTMDPSVIIDALAIFGSMFPYEMPTRVCDVCMEARPYDDIYVFDCNDSHKLCYECYYQSCQAKMTAGEILTCAICTNPLRDGELNQLRISREEVQKIREYQMRKTFDVYSSRTRGILKCPKQNCTWIAEAADPNERFKVNCNVCKHEFCSLCNQQYHYRTTCQQLPQITQRWFFWCQTERARYLTMRAQQDAAFATQLNDYNRRNNENENRNRDLARRYEELMNDEQYKVQNCRLCPSCQRVVQRLEGCDAMVCGQDAHGGNVQSGCSTKFNWQQAQPYKPSATKQPKQTIIDLPKPENPVVHHNGVKCDECKNDLNGIRFDCVHCPSLTYCEKCEQQSTLKHSRQNQTDGQQQHVFKLIMTPEEEAVYL